MLFLINLCTFPWWVTWLIPFLLGLALGWFLWGQLKGRIAELEGQNAKFRSDLKRKEDELSECQSSRAGLDSENALLKGRLREQSRSFTDRSTERQAFASSSKDSIAISKEEQPAKEEEVTIAPAEVETPKEPEILEGSDVAPPIESKSTEALGLKDAGIASTSPPKPARKNIYASLSKDNLQIVEGIGPKMNEVLNNAGVMNLGDLSKKTSGDIRAILDSVNAKRYRIIDPSSWPEQAGLAHAESWPELIKLQKNLDSGRAQGATGETDSKVEKLLIKMGVLKRWKENDLTAVEGIGPKISGLLIDGGFTTWRALANAEVSKLQDILDAAGKRYKLADPSSWPKQAEMAADGRWDDLEEYQDFLQGGK